jgi:glycosyltransferase involved in cell wall biosynthesis
MIHIALVGDATSINVRDWSKGLAAAGARVDLISFDPDPEGELPAHRLQVPPIVGRQARYLLAGPSVRRIVAGLDPDVVIGFYVTGYGMVALQARRGPLVEVPVGNDVLVNPSGRPAHFIARRNLMGAQLVAAWAPHIADAVRGFGVPPERIMTLSGGISLDPFVARGEPVGDPRQLITCRALDPYYRHDVLIRALAEVSDLGVSLTLVGSGPEKGRLAGLAGSLGIGERVAVTGWLPVNDKIDLLYLHGVYVSACPTDGVSASLLEAMAAGLFPIVVDYIANRQWIVSGENGLLVDGSPQSFASAIRHVVGSPELLIASRDHNRRLVRERADLRVNSALFVERFAALAAE